MAASRTPSPSSANEGAGRTSKGEETRARILGTALDLFRSKGYDATTMREVAKEAGVSVGNAYYYFPSKESLIQGFYGRVHEEHLPRALEEIAGTKDLLKRIRGILKSKIEIEASYHAFGGVLFRTAGDPRSALNPFSEESRPIRDSSIDVFRQAIQGCNIKVHKSLLPDLPELFWVYGAGITLYWVHDHSEDWTRTHALIDNSTDLIVRLIKLASNPLMAPIRKRAIKMVHEALGGVTA